MQFVEKECDGDLAAALEKSKHWVIVNTVTVQHFFTVIKKLDDFYESEYDDQDFDADEQVSRVFQEVRRAVLWLVDMDDDKKTDTKQMNAKEWRAHRDMLRMKAEGVRWLPDSLSIALTEKIRKVHGVTDFGDRPREEHVQVSTLEYYYYILFFARFFHPQTDPFDYRGQELSSVITELRELKKQLVQEEIARDFMQLK